MAKFTRRKIWVFVCVFAVIFVGLVFIFESIDKTTLAVQVVDGIEVRIIYDRDNMPILWLSGVGGLIWEAVGKNSFYTGRLPSQSGYDLAQDVIVEMSGSHPGRFSITDWESKKSSEWEIVIADNGHVVVREIAVID